MKDLTTHEKELIRTLRTLDCEEARTCTDTYRLRKKQVDHSLSECVDQMLYGDE